MNDQLSLIDKVQCSALQVVIGSSGLLAGKAIFDPRKQKCMNHWEPNPAQVVTMSRFMRLAKVHRDRLCVASEGVSDFLLRFPCLSGVRAHRIPMRGWCPHLSHTGARRRVIEASFRG